MDAECENPPQIKNGEDVKMIAVCDRNVDPLVLEEKFRDRVSVFDAPPASDGDNWIFENLTPWNRVLCKIGYGLDEYEPGRALLRPMKTYLHVSGDEEFIEMGFYLFYRLLKYHTCVKSLEIGGHLSFIQYTSLVNAALSASSSLESLKVEVVPEDPKHGEPMVKGIASLTTLEHLSLVGFILSATSTKMLVKMINNTRNLKSLRLDTVESSSEDIVLLKNAAAGLQNLTELAVTKKGLDGETAQAIAHLLSTTNTLTKLNLSDHWSIGDKILKTICDTLSSNKTVQVVNFGSTRLSNTQHVCLATALTQNTTVHEVIWDSDEVKDDGLKAIAGMIKSNNTLQFLNWNISFSEISVEGGLALAEAIAANTKLCRLSMNCVYADFETCKVIIEALGRNTTMQELGFHNTADLEKHQGEALASLIQQLELFGRIQMNLTVEGVYAQASVVRTSDKIQKVVVSWIENSTGEETRALFEAMCENTSIKELNVEVDLPQVVMPSVARFLRTTKTLKHLVMPIEVRESESFDEVMEALAENESITSLELRCEMLDSHSEEKLGSMLRRNRSIHTLIINDASTEFSVSRSPPHMVLADHLENNRTLLKLTNSYAWIPQDGLFRIEEVLRRNRRLLHRASAFALEPALDEKLSKDFQVLSHADSLIEHLMEVTKKTESEVRGIVAGAHNFLKINFPNM